MVTIAMLTGPNGLLSKATEAKIANDKAEIQDRAETEVLGSIGTNGKIEWDKLQGNLKRNFGEKTDITEKDGGSGLTFTVEKNKRNYEVDIDEKGKVTVKEEGESSGGGSSSSSEPSEEVGLKPGDTASKTQKDNYEDTTSGNNKKATIPQGFTVSSEDHEIDTGLVVEAPDGSEFVWVPVETAITANEADGTSNKAMAIKDPTNNTYYRGILYNFEGTTSSVMEGCTTKHFDDPIWSSGYDPYREPAYLTSYDGNTTGAPYNTVGLTEDGLKGEYKAMIESVDQYGGFYVGRYETSLTEKDTVQSKKGETSMFAAGYGWYRMYEKEKNYASDANISSVGSSMIWGSQYDAMLNWMLNGDDANKVASSSTQHEQTTTGSTPGDVMNKIYDLGNNLYEWTLEAYRTDSRVCRGSFYNRTYSPSYRGESAPINMPLYNGSRLTLYIK